MGGDENLKNYLAWLIELYIEQITKEGFTGWSAPLLFACNKIRVSHDEAHTKGGQEVHRQWSDSKKIWQECSLGVLLQK